ncbi:MAG: 4Fe-4S binding protein [Desulfobacterales bacterium]|nr:4Fe-4S binding protein [Desulfobacterales bacterium]
MKIRDWFLLLSIRQRAVLLLTLVLSSLIMGVGFLGDRGAPPNEDLNVDVGMSIRQIAPELGVTGKALARELGLPLDVSKSKNFRELDVSPDELSHAVHHLLSHTDATAKYYIFIALVLIGFVYLNFLGRPDGAGSGHRRSWYPRLPYNLALIISVGIAGFYLGKSPNPMEGIVKVFKSMVGLYPDPVAKATAFIFFLILAVIGNKMICGWACPFGALQELAYSFPIFRRLRRLKLPFVFTNTIRGGLLLLVLLFLFGVLGGREGFVIYHYINPFNLFNMHFEAVSILLTVIIVLIGSFFVYRPFCQLICPFGFVAWMFEGLSISKVRIDKEKCIQCGACIGACPCDAAKDRVYDRKLKADCFSCGRCLNVCPVDAIRYGSNFHLNLSVSIKPRSEGRDRHGRK